MAERGTSLSKGDDLAERRFKRCVLPAGMAIETCVSLGKVLSWWTASVKTTRQRHKSKYCQAGRAQRRCYCRGTHEGKSRWHDGGRGQRRCLTDRTIAVTIVVRWSMALSR